jgi:hypothetical protein
MKPELRAKIGLVAVLTLLVFISPVFAGGGFEPPDGATITGPEIWSVAVIYCPTNGPYNLATLRVKRVVDCNTETEAKVDPAWQGAGCRKAGGVPTTAADFEGQALAPGTTFFNLTAGTAFANKVKNFKGPDAVLDANKNTIGEVVSFDVQFKFYH